jgi:hypothetical protein
VQHVGFTVLKKPLESYCKLIYKGHPITLPEGEYKLEDHIKTVQPVLRLKTVP